MEHLYTEIHAKDISPAHNPETIIMNLLWNTNWVFLDWTPWSLLEGNEQQISTKHSNFMWNLE
jgi:hypothetical protein